ncbi:hypothetical protein [Sphingomonas sp.]|uniref:hypothetical protein n=1 Tax=Sphingomonas sp. TaxID=28214 RepID=UPI003BAA42F0
MSDPTLLNAPPCVSSQSLADRKTVMLARDEARREQWLRTRGQRSHIRRLLDWITR